MHKFIDCDGVILDTETGVFDEYHRLKEQNPDLRRTEYLEHMNWREWIRNAPIINNAIELLKEQNPKSYTIITKVHSLENEGKAKEQYFKEVGIKGKIILVLAEFKKTDLVKAKNNILVDDQVKNLDDWAIHEGIPLFFNKDGNNFCIFNEQQFENSTYPLVTSLEQVFDFRAASYCKKIK